MKKVAARVRVRTRETYNGTFIHIGDLKSFLRKLEIKAMKAKDHDSQVRAEVYDDIVQGLDNMEAS